ncbi:MULTISPECIES: cytosine permease [unclassified Sporosarcina]|uniref:purine-cytosine permease family protein n=1 Tax=unclassified Sporosarcina TaxID=2647733 RepID=UPI000C162E51|nr:MULTISPECIES: cytosine permease [unclassified Sporosarcina]PID02673.1 thiamine permease [Sporosarcina sp. P2]PID23994.1 thiamine permease [Sporosarcina sp. P7]
MGTKQQSIEQVGFEFIPESERKGNPRELFFTWFAASTVSTTLVTGALAVMIGLSFWWAALAILLGHAIGSVIMGLHSAQGPKLGIPQVLQSRAQFGYFGVILPMLIILTMYFGYGAMNTILVAQGIQETLGFNINVTVLFSLIPMVLLAIYGQNIIQKYMKLYTIVYTIIFVVLSVIVMSQLSMDLLSQGTFNWTLFILATSICVTWQITYGPYVSDHSRFMRSEEARKTFFYTAGGSFLSSAWLMLIGAAIATMVVNGNVMAEIKDMGATGYVIVILLSLGVLIINSLNIYGAGIIVLSIANNFWAFRTSARLRILTSIVIGIIIAFAATAGAGNFMSNFQIYLGFVLFFIIPWSVINLTDFYVLKRRFHHEEFMKKDGQFGRLNNKTMGIYLLTIVCQVPFINTEIYQGSLSKAMNGLDIAWIVGIIVAFTFYISVAKISNRYSSKEVSSIRVANPAE